MPDYEKMYFSLAEKVAEAVALLIDAQQQGAGYAAEEDQQPLVLFRPEEEPPKK